MLWEKGLIDKQICEWLETMVEINQELAESQKHEQKAIILGNTPKGLEVIRPRPYTLYTPKGLEVTRPRPYTPYYPKGLEVLRGEVNH